MSLLSVRDLTIVYDDVRAVAGASFDVAPGERVGIVGESGSGKTTLALALMRLLPPWSKQESGSVTIDGIELSDLPEERMRRLRGSKAGMVFQDPLTSFDPLRTLGDHLSEGLRAHGETDRGRRRDRAVQALRSVGMPAPRSQLARRPHELSGGMRQRGLIALGLSNNPLLLIADEPTTALDVTIQAQIMELFATIGTPGPQADMGLVIVSHNLGLIRQLCTRVIVMYGGRIVEDSPAPDFFARPRHPYAAALRDATPRITLRRGEVASIAGSAVDLADPPPGCPFEPRCAYRLDACAQSMPELLPIGGGHRVACFNHDAVGQAPGTAVADGPAPSPAPLPPEQPVRQPAAAAPLAKQPAEGAPLVQQPAEGASLVKEPVVGAPPVPQPVAGEPLVAVRAATKVYRVRRRKLHALAGVDLDVRAGETVALVGESGSGKSTLAHLVLGLQPPTSGTVRVAGDNPADPRGGVRRQQRMQAVFQDPHGSLNPRQRVGDAIAEPLVNLGMPRDERRRRVAELLDEVRLGQVLADRYPHELSGGQAQRVAIARALAARPELIVLDEPTASLDVSIQTHVIALLRDLQREHGLAYLFVSHDLVAVRELATSIAVMYLGRLVELAPWEQFFEQPLHPYSMALLSALPRVDLAPGAADRIVLTGEPPSPLDVPPGCPFQPRCPVAQGICATSPPPLSPVTSGRQVACHFPGSLTSPATSPTAR
ncbi:ABC transporter ATP-binding protein [Dactylosporangium sp. NPDC050688]|uniref:ABC transporter ATP-binding protein n=1 Tax=Dactylosporangium sp. NPDC050688 TaxID=3157217 RepID=UPI0033F86F0C